jgi:hypothetical protein
MGRICRKNPSGDGGAYLKSPYGLHNGSKTVYIVSAKEDKKYLNLLR